MLSELLNPFATKLGLMVYYRKVDCLVKRLDCSVVVKVKVTEKANVYLDNISSTAEPFVTKLVVVMYHHGPECHARRLVCRLQVQGHS